MGGYFFSFCGAWRGVARVAFGKSKIKSGERENFNYISYIFYIYYIYYNIYNIYKINICFTVAMTRISKIAMTRVPRHANKDNRIEQESTQESTQETSDRYQVRVILVRVIFDGSLT